MATEIYVCLDLGNDTLKLSFAYETEKGEVTGKLMLADLINQVALPAAAYYDEEKKCWYFAEKLEMADRQGFSTVVKIKALLSLLMPTEDGQNQQYYRQEHFFPKFSFPKRRKMESEFRYMVEQKLVFEVAGSTPQSVCEEFFRHVRKIVEKCIRSLSAETGIAFLPLSKIAFVHPPKQSDEYVDELTQLVHGAFGFKPIKILTSTQALGLYAFHRGLLGNGERVLLFDLGDETISVTKAWLNEIGRNMKGDKKPQLGILVDSREGHSYPLEVGGSNLDEDIAKYLESCIHNRETVGSPSSDMEGHIFENGLCAAQYLLMKDIKKTKMVMPMTAVKGSIFQDGVPISVHRETLVQRLLTSEEFAQCVGIQNNEGVARQVLEYVLRELQRAVNRDVTKLLFAGGLTETHGLMAYLKEYLSAQYPKLTVLTFDQEAGGEQAYIIRAHETSTYAASVGGAVVAMKNYSVDAVLSFSYGTWLYYDNDSRKHLKLFANRGDLLSEEENRFATEGTINVSYEEQQFLEGDELFSTIINTQEIREKAYADRVTYEDDRLIIGEEGSDDRIRARDAIDLRVVAGGDRTKIRFYHQGNRVALLSKHEMVLYFEEGFVVDKHGHATPFFSNLKEKNNVMVSIRNMTTEKISMVNAREIEFRLDMEEITVTTNR